MDLIGSISGGVKPTEFSVRLSTAVVEEGSFVKVNHEAYGWVLGRVDSLRRDVSDGEEVLLAKCYTIGYKQNEQILIPKTPFRVGDKVFTADRALIRSVIGIEKERAGSIYIGNLDGENIPVYLDVKKSIGKHMSILAKTGAGKSYTVAVILEELLKADVPCVVIDPHGEYSSLRRENDDYDAMLKFGVKPRSYEKEVKEYAANIIANPDAERLGLKPKFTLEELIDIMPMKLNDNQKSILYDVMRKLEGVDYSLKEIMDEVRKDDAKTKWKVISGLETLRDSGIFDGKPVGLDKLVKPGHASIINLRGVEPKIQELIITKLAKDLFTAAKLREVKPFFFLVEEAHNFCPERGFGDALSSQIMRTVASEGRKFGFHLGVVSQRPARVDKNVLSQCNTQIILKVTNPNDLRAIGQSIEGFTPGMEEDIQKLAVGQALIVGECVEQPVTVNIRARETKHYGATPTEVKKEPPKKPSLVDKIKPVFVKEDDEPSREKPAHREEKKEKPEKKKKTHLQRLKSIFLKD